MFGEIFDVINRNELAQLFAQYKDKVSYNSEKLAMENIINTFTDETNRMIRAIASGEIIDFIKLSGAGAVYPVSSFGVVIDVNGSFWCHTGLSSINFVDNLSGFPTVSKQDSAPWFKLNLNKLFSTFSPWTNLSLSNDWITYNSVWNTPSYKKENNKVYLRGLVKNGLTPTICTLPVNLRPLKSQMFVCNCDGAFCRIDVHPSGDISIVGTYSNVWVSLDNICFHLD